MRRGIDEKAIVYAAIVLGSMATSVNATTIEPTVYVCSPTDEGEAELDNIVEIATTAAQQKNSIRRPRRAFKRDFTPIVVMRAVPRDIRRPSPFRLVKSMPMNGTVRPEERWLLFHALQNRLFSISDP